MIRTMVNQVEYERQITRTLNLVAYFSIRFFRAGDGIGGHPDSPGHRASKLAQLTPLTRQDCVVTRQAVLTPWATATRI